MKISFDEDNRFLGIPKPFFDIADKYKPRTDDGSIGIRSILDTVKQAPFTDSEFSDYPFYAYPEYQYAVLAYIAYYAEKNAHSIGITADEIFSAIYLKVQEYINRQTKSGRSGYEENGNISFGAGRLRNMCDKTMTDVIIPFVKNRQLRQHNKERKYTTDTIVSLDTPIGDEMSEDKETTLGDTIGYEDTAFNTVEILADLESVRNLFNRDSDEWKIADWLIKEVRDGAKDIKHSWNEIASKLGYSHLDPKFRTKKKHIIDKLKEIRG